MIRFFSSLLITAHSQLYVVAARSKEGHSSPCLFALLPNKCTSTYTSMWRMVKEFLGLHTPTTLLCDMELAAVKAFLVVYPRVKIVFCFFHWRKALRDNLAKKKVEVEVNQSHTFNKLYRLVCALAFVPSSAAANVADAVIIPYINEHQDVDLSEEAVNWGDYFLDTYIGTVS